MELPEFNPQGSGPQGQGGIPPESIRQGLRDTGTDLVGSTVRPEDHPAAQQVLEAETRSIMSQLGLDPGTPPAPAAPRQEGAETPPAPPTLQPQAQPAAAAPHPAQPQRDDLAEKIRTVTEKYKGNFEQLAKAYVHTDAARTRAQQERGSELAELRQQVEGLNAQIAAALTARRDTPSLEDTLGQPRAAAPAATAEDAEQFWKNPTENISRIVRENFVALRKAEQSIEEHRNFDRFQREQAADIARLRPVMAQIYLKDRDLYDGLQERRVLEALLERAKERESAAQAIGQAAQFYQEIAAAGGLSPVEGAAGPGGPGPVTSSPGSSPRHVTPTPPPNGNWSNTAAFKRLWKTRDGGVDEMAAITDILRERGFGEHVS